MSMLESTAGDYAPSLERSCRLLDSSEGDVRMRIASPSVTQSRTDAAGRLGCALKRGIDVVGALVLLVVFLPALLVAAAGVLLTSPGPVIFRQTRVGRHGRPFTMLKFRTFPVDHVPPYTADEGETVVIPVAQSPSRFGRMLRQTSLDELPQLVNVLRGDMSLVGPRPERPELASALAARIPSYHDRHRVPVGLTGHAQVRGLCGTTSIELRVAADNEYIDAWSLRRDLVIMAMTVPTLLRKFRR